MSLRPADVILSVENTSTWHLGLLSPYTIQSFVSAFRNIHAYCFQLRCSMIGLTSFPAITPSCDLF
nr:MAG TPA: hypothetical protein [Caudoviricetes sp.]DAP87433.1 MAG TPA: hypothetical protein [Caudoviricetes sp.]